MSEYYPLELLNRRPQTKKVVVRKIQHLSPAPVQIRVSLPVITICESEKGSANTTYERIMNQSMSEKNMFRRLRQNSSLVDQQRRQMTKAAKRRKRNEGKSVLPYMKQLNLIRSKSKNEITIGKRSKILIKRLLRDDNVAKINVYNQ